MEILSNRQKVIKLKQTHPYWTLQEIGNELHLTRERVRQILKEENMQTRGFYKRESDLKHPQGVARYG